MTSSIAIVATGGSSGIPEFAGSTWVRLQYMLGLRRLGIDAFWVDHLACLDPRNSRHSVDFATSEFRRLASEFGFEDRYCIVYDGGATHFGLTEAELSDLASEARLYLAIGGQPPPTGGMMQVPTRVYVDVDPGFTQTWALQTDMGFDRFTHFSTVGQNVGRPDFVAPSGDIEWRPLLPPVVLAEWPPMIDGTCTRFSTVADWRGSQEAMLGDLYLGGKRSEFIRYLDVPMLAGQRIELALTIGQHDFEDIGLLGGHDWRLRDPTAYAGTPASYREFIQFSRAEFSVAKSGYVRSNSGWISDRTACYLASGKPALVQSTGFEWKIPTGEGLLTFSSVEEAVARIATVNSDYQRHAAAARRLAERFFDSDRVLGELLAWLAT